MLSFPNSPSKKEVKETRDLAWQLAGYILSAIDSYDPNKKTIRELKEVKQVNSNASTRVASTSNLISPSNKPNSGNQEQYQNNLKWQGGILSRVFNSVKLAAANISDSYNDSASSENLANLALVTRSKNLSSKIEKLVDLLAKNRQDTDLADEIKTALVQVIEQNYPPGATASSLKRLVNLLVGLGQGNDRLGFDLYQQKLQEMLPQLGHSKNLTALKKDQNKAREKISNLVANFASYGLFIPLGGLASSFIGSVAATAAENSTHIKSLESFVEFQAESLESDISLQTDWFFISKKNQNIQNTTQNQMGALGLFNQKKSGLKKAVKEKLPRHQLQSFDIFLKDYDLADVNVNQDLMDWYKHTRLLVSNYDFLENKIQQSGKEKNKIPLETVTKIEILRSRIDQIKTELAIFQNRLQNSQISSGSFNTSLKNFNQVLDSDKDFNDSILPKNLDLASFEEGLKREIKNTKDEKLKEIRKENRLFRLANAQKFFTRAALSTVASLAASNSLAASQLGDNCVVNIDNGYAKVADHLNQNSSNLFLGAFENIPGLSDTFTRLNEGFLWAGSRVSEVLSGHSLVTSQGMGEVVGRVIDSQKIVFDLANAPWTTAQEGLNAATAGVFVTPVAAIALNTKNDFYRLDHNKILEMTKLGGNGFSENTSKLPKIQPLLPDSNANNLPDLPSATISINVNPNLNPSPNSNQLSSMISLPATSLTGGGSQNLNPNSQPATYIPASPYNYDPNSTSDPNLPPVYTNPNIIPPLPPVASPNQFNPQYSPAIPFTPPDLAQPNMLPDPNFEQKKFSFDVSSWSKQNDLVDHENDDAVFTDPRGRIVLLDGVSCPGGKVELGGSGYKASNFFGKELGKIITSIDPDTAEEDVCKQITSKIDALYKHMQQQEISGISTGITHMYDSQTGKKINNATTAVMFVPLSKGRFVLASVGDSYGLVIDKNGRLKLKNQLATEKTAENFLGSSLQKPIINFETGIFEKDDTVILLTDWIDQGIGIDKVLETVKEVLSANTNINSKDLVEKIMSLYNGLDDSSVAVVRVT